LSAVCHCHIWKARNDRVFQQKVPDARITAREFISDVKDRLEFLNLHGKTKTD